MASNLKTGETVLVPSRTVERDDYAFAMIQSSVLEKKSRSVRVDSGGGIASKWIPTSKVHRQLGVLIVVLGDFDSELPLLDPLSKSALQYCRLLLKDDFVRQVKLRSLAELRAFWSTNESVYTHVVLIGHGREDAVKCAVEGWVSAAQLCDAMSSTGSKDFISLCCESGRAPFAKPFSLQPVCRTLIAPFHSIHGAVASQFVQTMLAHAFLNGETTAVAFRHAREAVPDGKSFRLWKGGLLQNGLRVGA